EDPIDYSADGGDDGDDEMDIEEDEDADIGIVEERGAVCKVFQMRILDSQ
ncbi:hypothetical protein Tco_0716405, partial [Tanacetum coccineum]